MCAGGVERLIVTVQRVGLFPLKHAVDCVLVWCSARGTVAKEGSAFKTDSRQRHWQER